MNRKRKKLTGKTTLERQDRSAKRKGNWLSLVFPLFSSGELAHVGKQNIGFHLLVQTRKKGEPKEADDVFPCARKIQA